MRETLNIAVLCAIIGIVCMLSVLPVMYNTSSDAEDEDIGDGTIEWKVVSVSLVKTTEGNVKKTITKVDYHIHNDGYRKAEIFTGDFSYKTYDGTVYGPMLKSIGKFTLTKGQDTDMTLYYDTTKIGTSECLMLHYHTSQMT